ncbi:MAG: hypothetical protein M3150_04465, partial [Pseudomonadota bacterium]|nr:hypothetical protein [Pseudomonadota bacterium]
MTERSTKPPMQRRDFLGTVIASGAATVLSTAEAADQPVPAGGAARPSALPPSAHGAQAETGVPPDLGRIQGKPGSDFMVDVIKSLDIKYLPSNCASSFRGLH